MTIAIMFDNSDILWIDAVVQYSRNYPSKITKHPIALGATISDNIIRDPLTISIQGIISNADFNIGRSDTDADNLGNLLNNNPINQSVSVTTATLSPLGSVISALSPVSLADPIPNISMQKVRAQNIVQIADSKLTNCWTNGQTVTILDLDENGFVIRSFENMAINNYGPEENPDTGDALEFKLQLEQIVKVVIQSAVVGKVKVLGKGDQSNGISATVDDASAAANAKIVSQLDPNGSVLYQTSMGLGNFLSEGADAGVL